MALHLNHYLEGLLTNVFVCLFFSCMFFFFIPFCLNEQNHKQICSSYTVLYTLPKALWVIHNITNAYMYICLSISNQNSVIYLHVSFVISYTFWCYAILLQTHAIVDLVSNNQANIIISVSKTGQFGGMVPCPP